MVTELRTKGDRIVLYTDDRLVYRRLSRLKCVLHRTTYFQGGKKVAADLYFDKRLKNVLLQVIKGQQPLGV